MRLVVTTPQATVVDTPVVHVRAEDESGAFGVMKGHADLLTPPSISVLVYRGPDHIEHFVAVRGGVLTVTEGTVVQVLTREAIASDDLASLEGRVLTRFRRSEADEQRARAGAGRLEGALLRRVADYVRIERRRVDKGVL
ncbi:MAG: F0F1 ATP synthase subunit epsilon [Polyangiaceae bacterium]